MEHLTKLLKDSYVLQEDKPEKSAYWHLQHLRSEIKQLALTDVINCAKVEDKPTPLNWLLHDKLGIEKGATYTEPKLTVRQCASWISEYVKNHCC